MSSISTNEITAATTNNTANISDDLETMKKTKAWQNTELSDNQRKPMKSNGSYHECKAANQNP